MIKRTTLLLAAALSATAVTRAADTAYGYQFQSRNNVQAWVSFNVNTPQQINLDKRVFADSHPTAAEYVDGKIYAYRCEFGDFSDIYPDSWAIYDAETFAVEYSSDRSDRPRVVDMTYDYTTNTMYALVEDAYCSGALTTTSLAVVNMASGAMRVFDTPGELHAIDGYNRDTIDALITIAADNQGQLYAMSAYRYLYKLDKFTGRAYDPAPRHNLGTAEQFQSMAFDTDGTLWWAQQHPSYGHFCSVNLETGVPGGFTDWQTDYPLLNKLGDDIQLTGLYFKDKSVRPSSSSAPVSMTAAVDANDVHTVHLSWTAPQTDYAGNPAQVDGYRIYRIGTSAPIATVSGQTLSYTDANAPDGITLYEVLPYNADGNGFPVFADVFAGYDRLNPVENITIQLNGNDVTLTWAPPSSTENGGYADYNAITYNVYRVRGDETTAVATALPTSVFTEPLPRDGAYSYIIEPISGGIVGCPAQSESVSIASTATIPYSTGFEDEQDGLLWTCVNADNQYGWTIGTDYYVYEGKCAFSYTGGSTRPGDDWLFSPAIRFNAGEHTLVFYSHGSSYDTHSFDVLLGTDPEDTATYTIPIWSVDNQLIYDTQAPEHPGWQKIEATFTVPAAGIYRLAVHDRTTEWYAKLRIDNLSISGDPTVSLTDVSAHTPIVICRNNAIEVITDQHVNSICIIDAAGRTVASTTGKTIATDHIAPGIVMVAITTPDGTFVKKTVIR